MCRENGTSFIKSYGLQATRKLSQPLRQISCPILPFLLSTSTWNRCNGEITGPFLLCAVMAWTFWCICVPEARTWPNFKGTGPERVSRGLNCHHENSRWHLLFWWGLPATKQYYWRLIVSLGSDDSFGSAETSSRRLQLCCQVNQANAVWHRSARDGMLP